MSAVPPKSRLEGARLYLVLDLPPYECAQNAHVHWSRSNKARAEYRQYVSFEARSALNRAPKGHPWKNEAPAKVRVHLTFGIKPRDRKNYHSDGRYRPTDTDNAVGAFKGGMDGLKDAKVIRDDNFRHLTLGDVDIDPEAEGLTVIVEVVEW